MNNHSQSRARFKNVKLLEDYHQDALLISRRLGTSFSEACGASFKVMLEDRVAAGPLATADLVRVAASLDSTMAELAAVGAEVKEVVALAYHFQLGVFEELIPPHLKAESDGNQGEKT